MAILLGSEKIYNTENSKIIDNRISSVSCKGYETNSKNYEETFAYNSSSELQVFSEGFIENASKITEMTIKGTVTTKQLQLNETGGDFISTDVVSKDIDGDIITEHFSVTFNGNQLYSKNEGLAYEYDTLTIFNRNYSHSDGGSYSVDYTLNMTDNMRGIIRSHNGAFVPPDKYFKLENVEIKLIVLGVKKDFEEAEIFQVGFENQPSSAFKIDANELLQSSSEIPKNISDNIKNEWIGGKETAKILCSISEYYNENGKIAVSNRLPFSEDVKEITTSYKKNYIEYSDYNKSFDVPNGGGIDVEWYDSFSKYDFEAGCYNIIATPNSAINYGYLRLGDNEDPNSCDFYVDIEFGKHYIFEIGKKKTLYFHFNKSKKHTDDLPYPAFLFKISFSEKIPMTFDIKNEVIPMVFGADGRDRPMSRYNDGSPKVFNVVGRKMIYDGAVWQELTLQEKTQCV